MLFFIHSHLFKDGAGLLVFVRYLFKVFVQMLAHLALGGGDEARLTLSLTRPARAPMPNDMP